MKLLAAELDRGYAAMNHHGYSTLLPDLSEWSVVQQEWPRVRAAIAEVDLSTYRPSTPMIILAPKSRTNVRQVHLLHPQDIIVYTSMIMQFRNVLEVERLPVDVGRVYSYRSNPDQEDRLYESRASYEQYMRRLSEKSADANVKFVSVADIADFYPRIPQALLMRAVDRMPPASRGRRLGRLLLTKFLPALLGTSTGIPVGPYASRLLGEAALVEVDREMLRLGLDFVRWVDDYNIFCKTEYEAQMALFKLEAALVSFGLSAHSAKSRVLPTQDYRSSVLRVPMGPATDRDALVTLLREFEPAYEDEEDDESQHGDEEHGSEDQKGRGAVRLEAGIDLDPETPSSEQAEEVLAALEATDVEELLARSLGGTSLADFQVLSNLLGTLSKLPSAPNGLKRAVLTSIVEHLALLYPIAEQASTYIQSANWLTRSERSRIGAKILRTIEQDEPPEYLTLWMLEIFESSSDWNNRPRLLALYQGSQSEIVKRWAALAISANGTVQDAEALMADYAVASPLLRLSIAFATKRLGSDIKSSGRRPGNAVDRVIVQQKDGRRR